MRKPLQGISWLAKLNLITPKFCRLVARKKDGKTAMTNKEIALVSGLSVGTVRRLYSLATWNNVTAETIHRYTKACGVDLLRPGRGVMKFLRREKLHYMKKACNPHRKLFDRLRSATPSAH